MNKNIRIKIYIKDIIQSINIVIHIIGLKSKHKPYIQDYFLEAKTIDYVRRYFYVLENPTEATRQSSYQDKIWQLWYQDVDQAPKIVRKCMEKVYEFSGGREVILLNEKNINNYISIPGYIFDKKKTGYISNVHFSDILRACLLTEHGGIWLDATVMLTSKIPSYILNTPFFCFATTPKELRGIGNIIASSWFIQSISNHIIMKSTKDLLLEYWKKEKDIRHYYLFHLIFAAAISFNGDCKKEWDRVPFFSNVPPHVLQMELFKNYNEERFEQIKKMTSIHKLTFYGGEEFDTEKKNTFYDILINRS